MLLNQIEVTSASLHGAINKSAFSQNLPLQPLKIHQFFNHWNFTGTWALLLPNHPLNSKTLLNIIFNMQTHSLEDFIFSSDILCEQRPCKLVIPMTVQIIRRETRNEPHWIPHRQKKYSKSCILHATVQLRYITMRHRDKFQAAKFMQYNKHVQWCTSFNDKQSPCINLEYTAVDVIYTKQNNTQNKTISD